MRTRDIEDEDLLQFRDVYDFKPRRIEERRPCARLAVDERWIKIRSARSVLIHSSRPRLERNIGGARRTSETGTNFPIAFLIGCRAQIHSSVRPSRSRSG